MCSSVGRCSSWSRRKEGPGILGGVVDLGFDLGAKIHSRWLSSARFVVHETTGVFRSWLYAGVRGMLQVDRRTLIGVWGWLTGAFAGGRWHSHVSHWHQSEAYLSAYRATVLSVGLHCAHRAAALHTRQFAACCVARCRSNATLLQPLCG
jgi:hypothetical protein